MAGLVVLSRAWLEAPEAGDIDGAVVVDGCESVAETDEGFLHEAVPRVRGDGRRQSVEACRMVTEEEPHVVGVLRLVPERERGGLRDKERDGTRDADVSTS